MKQPARFLDKPSEDTWLKPTDGGRILSTNEIETRLFEKLKHENKIDLSKLLEIREEWPDYNPGHHKYLIDVDQFVFYNEKCWEFNYSGKSLERLIVTVLTEWENDVGNPMFHCISNQTITNLIKKYTMAAATLPIRSILDQFTKLSKSFYDGDSRLTELWLNLRNGVLKIDIYGFEFELVDHHPDYLFTSYLDVKWDPEANYGFWVKTISEIVGDDAENIQFIRTFMGNAIINKDFSLQMSPWLYGPLAYNGKSTL